MKAPNESSPSAVFVLSKMEMGKSKYTGMRTADEIRMELYTPSLFTMVANMKYWQMAKMSPLNDRMLPIDFSDRLRPAVFDMQNNGKASSNDIDRKEYSQYTRR